jgi:hypothetical protein
LEDDRIEDISTSGSDPTFDTMTSVCDEETNINRTRAQKVHCSSILAPKFKNMSSMSMKYQSANKNAVCTPISDVKHIRTLSDSKSAQKLSFPLPMTNNLFETSVSSESSAKSSR